MTVYLEFYRDVTRQNPENEAQLNIPNYDFSAVLAKAVMHTKNDEAWSADKIAAWDDTRQKTCEAGYSWIAANKHPRFAFSWRIHDFREVVLFEGAKFQIFGCSDNHPRWAKIENNLDSIQVANTYCAGLIATRSVEYVDDTGPDITALNAARAKRGKTLMPVPKIIRLNDVRYPSALGSHTGEGHKLSHMVEVASQTRHYRNPIKRGPNAGKTVIQVRPHIRGAGLPPKPQTAEYMQHRVIP